MNLANIYLIKTGKQSKYMEEYFNAEFAQEVLDNLTNIKI